MLGVSTPREANRLRAALGLSVAVVFASGPRKDQRSKGECYLRGLMLDGWRKSIQPMAERLPDGDMQALQQFVSLVAVGLDAGAPADRPAAVCGDPA